MKEVQCTDMNNAKEKIKCCTDMNNAKEKFQSPSVLGPLPSLLGNLVFSLLVKTFSRCLVSFTALEGESLK